MRPPEAGGGRGATLFLHQVATCSASSRDRGQKVDSRAKREETSDKISNCLPLGSLHFYTAPLPLRTSVGNRRESHRRGGETESLHIFRAPRPPRGERKKQQRASEGLFRKSFENQRVQRRESPAHIPAFLQCPVTTSLGAKSRPKKNL